jgi:hypothetical protein
MQILSIFSEILIYDRYSEYRYWYSGRDSIWEKYQYWNAVESDFGRNRWYPLR